jgi:hypothetical protein
VDSGGNLFRVLQDYENAKALKGGNQSGQICKMLLLRGLFS